MCETLLGIISVKGESIVSSMIKLKWLRDNLFPIDENSSIEVVATGIATGRRTEKNKTSLKRDLESPP